MRLLQDVYIYIYIKKHQNRIINLAVTYTSEEKVTCIKIMIYNEFGTIDDHMNLSTLFQITKLSKGSNSN